MRIVPLILVLGLTACGVSRDDHQRALDEQKRLTADAVQEKAAIEKKLVETEAKLSEANAAGMKSAAEAAELKKQVYVLTAQLRTREAQMAWDDKQPAQAERLVKQAYDAAKAAGAAGAKDLSEAFNLVKQKKPAAGKALEDAANALSSTMM